MAGMEPDELPEIPDLGPIISELTAIEESVMSETFELNKARLALFHQAELIQRTVAKLRRMEE